MRKTSQAFYKLTHFAIPFPR